MTQARKYEKVPVTIEKGGRKKEAEKKFSLEAKNRLTQARKYETMPLTIKEGSLAE